MRFFFAEIPLKEFIAVFWRTWIIVLAPFLLAPLLFLAEDPQVFVYLFRFVFLFVFVLGVLLILVPKGHFCALGFKLNQFPLVVEKGKDLGIISVNSLIHEGLSMQ